jgi:hypothetical protein
LSSGYSQDVTRVFYRRGFGLFTRHAPEVLADRGPLGVLLDDTRDWDAAATGDAGKFLLNRHHDLKRLDMDISSFTQKEAASR